MRYLTEEHNEITVDGERSTAEKVRDRWKIQVKDKLLDKFLDKFSDKSKTLNESYWNEIAKLLGHKSMTVFTLQWTEFYNKFCWIKRFQF